MTNSLKLNSTAFFSEIPTWICYELSSDYNQTKKALLGHLCGYAAGHLSLALTPLTILADVIMGIWFSKHPPEGEDGKKMFHKFAIISPIQQIVNSGVNGLIYYGLYKLWKISHIAKILIFIIPFWKFSYIIGQSSVYLLPNSLNQNAFKIFIRDVYPSLASDTSQNLDKASKTFKERLKEAAPYCKGISENDAYGQFKCRICENATAREVLGFSQEDPLDQKLIEKTYKKLATVLHPDKNKYREKEAGVLFNCLSAAYELLLERN